MSDSVVVASHRSVAISPTEWDCMKDQARMFINAECLPFAIKKPEHAMVIMMKGRELGIPPMAALSSISLIKGTPALSAQLMLALCRRDIPGFRHGETETTDKIARVWVQRPGEEKLEYSFSIKDAEDANLLYVKPGNQPGSWQKYPKRMLLWRAYSFACRTVCPEVLLGCYTPEEVEEFEARDVTPPAVTKPDYLPSVEPRATARDHVSALKNVPGSFVLLEKLIAQYRKTGNEKYADQIIEAMDAEGMNPATTEKAHEPPPGEALPFETEKK